MLREAGLTDRSSNDFVSLSSPVEGIALPDVLVLFVPEREMQESLVFRAAKRIMDVLIATIALTVLSPVMLFLALVIKLQDNGPVFYRQSRVGRFGVPFPFYKFRSMRVDADRIKAELLHLSDAEGAAFKMKNDPRVTPLGRYMRKFSLDELPQLFSVLAGHMSIIGPRPHLRNEVATYSPSQRARLLVKPGLICVREISGRSHLTFDQWVELDLEYVRTRSLWVDLRIFVLAFPAVISGKGAY